MQKMRLAKGNFHKINRDQPLVLITILHGREELIIWYNYEWWHGGTFVRFS